MTETEMSENMAEELDYEHEGDGTEASDPVEPSDHVGEVGGKSQQETENGIEEDVEEVVAKETEQEEAVENDDSKNGESGEGAGVGVDGTAAEGDDGKDGSGEHQEESDKPGVEKNSTNSGKPNKPVITKITMSSPAVIEKDKGEYVCRLCNLVFESNKFYKEHRSHSDHYYASKGKTPGKCKFPCLLCWKEFIQLDGVEAHLETKEHKDRCRRKGVTRLFCTPEEYANIPETEKKNMRDRELERDRQDRDRRPSKRPRGPTKVNFNYYYEVDSVGECDTFGKKFRKLSPRRSGSKKRDDRTRSTVSQSKDSDKTKIAEGSIAVASLTQENLSTLEHNLETSNIALAQSNKESGENQPSDSTNSNPNQQNNTDNGSKEVSNVPDELDSADQADTAPMTDDNVEEAGFEAETMKGTHDVEDFQDIEDVEDVEDAVAETLEGIHDVEDFEDIEDVEDVEAKTMEGIHDVEDFDDIEDVEDEDVDETDDQAAVTDMKETIDVNKHETENLAEENYDFSQEGESMIEEML